MKKKAHSIDMLFMLVLFSVFAIMSVLLIIIGSDVYGKIVDSQEMNSDNRNILSYVTNKVRTSQAENGVYIEEKDGTPVLVIKNSEDEYDFSTLIFFTNGQLKEATISNGDEYNLDFGDILAEVSDFTFGIDEESGVLELSVANGDSEKNIDVYIGSYQ